MENNLLFIDSLPLDKKFIDLPYANETLQFTGNVSDNWTESGYTIKSAEVVICHLTNGKTMIHNISFYYDIDLKTFVKRLNSNFYEFKN